MPILINVTDKHKTRAKKLGACTTSDGRTWFIPDEIKNLNPFKRWLPQGEGFYVQKPYSLARSRLSCYNCKKITPVIALRGGMVHEAVAATPRSITWKKHEFPVHFTEITYLDRSVDDYLKENYTFFKLALAEDDDTPIWGNTCIHCGFLIDAHGEFRYGTHALNPLTHEEACEIRTVYFDLPFDYYIRACWSYNPLVDDTQDSPSD